VAGGQKTSARLGKKKGGGKFSFTETEKGTGKIIQMYNRGASWRKRLGRKGAPRGSYEDHSKSCPPKCVTKGKQNPEGGLGRFSDKVGYEIRVHTKTKGKGKESESNGENPDKGGGGGGLLGGGPEIDASKGRPQVNQWVPTNCFPLSWRTTDAAGGKKKGFEHWLGEGERRLRGTAITAEKRGLAKGGKETSEHITTRGQRHRFRQQDFTPRGKGRTG